MRKRIVYTDEPIKLGRRVGREILPTHGGARAGAGRPLSGNQSVTLRLPVELVANVRRDAKRAGQSLSQFVAARLAHKAARRAQVRGQVGERAKRGVPARGPRKRVEKLKQMLGSVRLEVDIGRSRRRPK